tara:strand:+ start:625 stop:1218 length:594 start_codon:yes stop_codon:yes gene_type:complete
MQTVQQFLEQYVAQNGSARVIVDGGHVDLDVDGVEQVTSLPADVYAVVDTGINERLASEVDAIVISSKDPMTSDEKQFPKANVNALEKGFMVAELSETLFAFTKNGLPHGSHVDPEPMSTTTPPPPEPIGTTIPPPPDEGVPFSITGGEPVEEEDVDEDVEDEVEDDEVEDDEVEDDEDSEEDDEDSEDDEVSGMVW